MSARTCPICRCGLHPAFDVEFMTADREFFESNPGLPAYIRAPFPSEHPFACAGVERVEVLSIGPGLRLRREVAA